MFILKYTLAKNFSKFFGFLFKNEFYRILMYHSIGDEVPHDALKLYHTSKKNFALQMKYLKNKKVNNDFDTNLIGDSCLSVSFDDGYASILTNASNILFDLNIPFVLFITPSFINSGNSLYLNQHQLKELANNDLCTIGAHSYSHLDLTKCDAVKLKSELQKSKFWLENLIGKEVNLMSYPFGKYDVSVIDQVKKIGYKYGFTSNFGSNKANTNLLSLNRTDIWSYDDIDNFILKVNGYWDWIKYINE